jgi:hypothetical protein
MTKIEKNAFWLENNVTIAIILIERLLNPSLKKYLTCLQNGDAEMKTMFGFSL